MKALDQSNLGSTTDLQSEVIDSEIDGIYNRLEVLKERKYWIETLRQ